MKKKQTKETKEEILEETLALEQEKESAKVDMGHSTSLVLSHGTIQYISSGDDPKVDNSLVKVTVHYPKDFTGARYLTDGKTYEVSKATAELFIEKGIAQSGSH